ncbi:MAG: hypothetical protein ACRDHS_07050, partial [Actinomycetota bacterium]
MEETHTMPEASGAGAAVEKPNGPVAAVFIAAGIGSLVLGTLTTLAEASEDLKSWLELSESVGSLSGKTIIATATFFVAWAILAALFRGRSMNVRTVFIWTALLVAIALVLTFPTFFEL